MAILPNASDLGTTSISGTRPVGDLGNPGGMLQQTGRIAENAYDTLGRGLESAGVGMAMTDLDRMRYETAMAHSEFETGRIALDNQYLNDSDPYTREERYTTDITNLANTAAARVPGALQQRFRATIAPTVEKGIADQNIQASRLSLMDAQVKLQQKGDWLIQQTIQNPDDGVRARAIDTFNSDLDALAGSKKIGGLTPIQVQKMKQEYAQKFIDARKSWEINEAKRTGDWQRLDQLEKEVNTAPPLPQPPPPKPLGHSKLNQSRIDSIDSNPQVAALQDDAERRYNLPPGYLKVQASIESSGNPNAHTGSYYGLHQISPAEFQRHGGAGSILDPAQNTEVAAQIAAANAQAIKNTTGEDATPTMLYMAHQQGLGGAIAHVSNPNSPAWVSMYSTAEGQQKGPGWAKMAVWGNIPDNMKRQFGNVNNVTSGDLYAIYDSKVRGIPLSQAYAELGQRQGVVQLASLSQDDSSGGAADSGGADGGSAAPVQVAQDTGGSVPSAVPPNTSSISFLNENQRQKLLMQIDSAKNQITNNEWRQAQRNERELRQAQDNKFDQYYGDAIEGKPLPDTHELAGLIRGHVLRPEQAKVIANVANEGRDDPQVLMELQARINRGEDVSDDIGYHLDQKELKGKTALGLMRAVGTRIDSPLVKSLWNEVKTLGLGDAVEKGLIDLSNQHGQEVVKRYQSIQNEWTNRVMIGHEDPIKVRDDMVQKWAPDLATKFTLPRPMFAGAEVGVNGKPSKTPLDMSSVTDVNAVAMATYARFKSGAIDPKTYQSQVSLLNQWRSVLQQGAIGTMPTPSPQQKTAPKIIGNKPKTLGTVPESGG